MQSTLLVIVQDMLTAIQAESVTTVVSGSTTEEALMCVNIANREFEKLISKYKWKHLRTFTNLAAGVNLNELKGAAGVCHIDGENVYYGDTDEEARIRYVAPEDFVSMTMTRTAGDANVDVINKLKIYNDRVPSFYTTFDDVYLVFDAMPSGAGLVASDSYALVYTEPTARLSTNAQTFNIPAKVYPDFVTICIGQAIKELGDDKTDGENIIQKAYREISKKAYEGKLVEVNSDYRKYMTVRTSRRYASTVDVREV